MSVRVSVIVPVRNGEATLGDMLAALVAQKEAGETEVLVVDNGSTDRTADIARQFPVTLLHESTPGTSAARNAALRVARGEIIACLDADTLPTRRWLSELIRPFSNPAVMIVGGKVLTYSPTNATEMYYDACDMYGSRHNVYAKVFQFAVGMNAAVRTSAAREAGGWEESLMWGEDIDFSERILRRFPDSLAYAEKAVLFHRHRSTHEALVRQALGYGRGAAMIHQRYPDKSTWRALSPLIVAGCVAGRWGNVCTATARRMLGRMDRTRADITYCHALWSWHFWRGFFIEYYWLRTHKRT